jgi:FdhD protein
VPSISVDTTDRFLYSLVMTSGFDKAANMTRVECHTFGPSGVSPAGYDLITEGPLLITVAGKPLVTLMYTPGEEIPLSIGYLYTEGVIHSEKDIGAIGFCREESGNVVRVTPAEGADIASRLTEHRAVFSSCSICGREAITSVTDTLERFTKRKERVSQQAIVALGKMMDDRQHLFRRTGGAHAALLVLVSEGMIVPEMAILREDVGRHNALDKAVGEALLRRIPFEQSVLMLSGRLSFEMVAKAARAGISDVVAVSAPTALAVELAHRLNMLLVGFARGDTGIIYTGKEALKA